MDNTKKVFSKRIRKKRKIKLTLKFIFTNVDFNEGRHKRTPRQSRRVQIACRRVRQGRRSERVPSFVIVFAKGNGNSDRRPGRKAPSVWKRALLCSLKISESSQRPIQDKVLTSPPPPPPRPSDDGLTRREPESSGGKISAGLPARYWNTTGSCSVLRVTLSLLVRRGPFPAVGNGPRSPPHVCHNSMRRSERFMSP